MSRSIAHDILVQSKPRATSTDQSWMLALSSMLLLSSVCVLASIKCFVFSLVFSFVLSHSLNHNRYFWDPVMSKCWKQLRKVLLS
jgi:hypothetical protein